MGPAHGHLRMCLAYEHMLKGLAHEKMFMCRALSIYARGPGSWHGMQASMARMARMACMAPLTHCKCGTTLDTETP